MNIMTRFYIIALIAITAISAFPASRVELIRQKLEPLSGLMLVETGNECLSRNSCDTAFTAFSILHERFARPRTPDEKDSLAIALNGIGIVWFMKAEYGKAYIYFKKAEAAGSLSQQINALNNLASMYYYFRDIEKSHRYYTRAFRMAESLKDWNSMSIAALNLMNLEFENSKNGRVDPIYIKTVRGFKGRPDNSRTEYIEQTGFAMELVNKKEYGLAERAFANTLALTDSLYMPPRQKYNVLINMARTALFAGNGQRQLEYLNKADSIAEECESSELKIDIWGKLADYYDRHGEKNLSNHYRYRKYALSDSSFTALEMKRIYDVDLEMEAEKYERKINTLDVKLEWRGRWLLTLSIMLTLTVSLGLLTWKQNRTLKDKNRSLFKANCEIMEKTTMGMTCIESQANTAPIAVEPESGGSTATDPRSVDKALLARILKIMEQTEVICRNDFSLALLAELCGSNTRYVSSAINEGLGMNFPSLVNRYRIDVARRLLLDQSNSRYTLETIVERLGYKSRSSFSKTFKKFTGLSPSEFIKLAREKQNHTECQGNSDKADKDLIPPSDDI